MTVETPEAPELPDLPAFDDRAMRRAVRRGVIRTAFVGAVWLVVASIVLGIAGRATLVGLGREDHLKHVVALGWQVAHPEFSVGESGQHSGAVHATETFDAVPIVVQSAPATTKLSFSESLFGGLSRSYPYPTTAATDVLLDIGYGGTADALRAQERTLLGQLPKPVRVAAIVEFAQPLSYADYTAFVARNGPETETVLHWAPLLLSAAGDLESRVDGSNTLTGMCAWSPVYAFRLLHLNPKGLDDPIGEFRSWVGSLHDSDRGALGKVGVSLAKLRSTADAGLVHGVIVGNASAALLLKLLADPSVGAVHPYDVAFAVEGGA